MKKLVSLFLLLLVSKMIFGQQEPIFVPGTTQHDYLKKSRNQKTAAWVLLGTGSLSLLLASIEVNPNYGESNRSFLAVGGLVAVSASVPCFIASRRNKKMAMRLSFNHDRLPIGRNNFAYKSIPSLGLRINF